MFESMIVPTDFSDASHATALKALELAKKFGAKVYFIHVIEPSETIPYPIHVELESYQKLAMESATKDMRTFISKLNLSGIDWEEEIELGAPYQKIHGYAKDKASPLIVIASHGKSTIEKFFVGSVTDRLMRTTDIDVLLTHESEDK